jgi:hypothetical protein
MYTIFGNFNESFSEKINGLYSLDILMYDEEDQLIDRYSISNQPIITTFIKEFSFHKLDEIGKRVKFVVFDNTPYFPGTKALALLVWVNSNKEPLTLSFNANLSDNILFKRKEFTIQHFKNCVFEYDVSQMKNDKNKILV